MELKSSRFKAEYAGKMNLYLKLSHKNNSIGLILCKDSNDFEADYILPKSKRLIGVSELKLFRTLPKNWMGKIPDPIELEKELNSCTQDGHILINQNGSDGSD